MTKPILLVDSQTSTSSSLRPPRWRLARRHRDESVAVQGEEGNTLIEVLLSVIILGLAGVALMTGFATTIFGSAQHRQLATFETIVVAMSQTAISGIQRQPALFTTCPANAVAYYQGAVPLKPHPPNDTNYAAAITAVQYWNGTAFTTTCVKSQPQQITVTVTRTGPGTGPVSYSNTFDVTYPLAPSTVVYGVATSLVFSVQPGGSSGGLPLSPQPQVTVQDANGVAVVNDLSPVVLSVTNNVGTIVGCSGAELNGVVTFSGCAVTTAGTYTLTASDANLTPVVSATFVVGAAPPSLVFISPQPVAGASGSVLTTMPTIEVETSGGVLVNSSTATITLVASSGTLSGCSNLTAVGGFVRPTGCTFAGLVGTFYTLNATSSGLVPGSSNSITPSSPGPATQLLFTTQPSGVASSNATTAFSSQPVVTAKDSAGNIASSFVTPVTLSANTGNVVTCANNAVTPSSGIASYSGCHNGAYANGITLKATAGPLSVVSTAFNVTGLPSKLVFVTQPVAGDSGTSLTTQPVIQVQDANGNVVTSVGVSVALTPSGGTLTHCAGLGTSSGVVYVASCNFAGLVNANYTLVATATGLTSATSAVFSPVGAGVEAQLTFTTQPVAGASESTLTSQPIVKVEDSGGNVQTASADTITLSSSGGTLANCTNLTAIAGVVNVENCTFAGSLASTYTLSAATGSLTPATSASITPTAPGPLSQILISGCPTSISFQASCTVIASAADVYNNVITSFTGPVTFAQTSGSGAVTGLASVNAVNGTAADPLTGATIGTVQVNASIAAPSLTSNSLTFSVLAIPQSITWNAPPTQTWVAGGNGTFALGTATDTSLSAVTFASSTPSVCSVAGTTATMITAGTCSITPSAAAQGNYLTTVGSTSNITINKIAQSALTIALPNTDIYPYSITLTTSGGSGTGAVTYSVVNGTASGCSLSGAIVTATSYGTCTVTANKAGDVNYLAATPVVATETFSQAAQATLTTVSTSDTYPYSMVLTIAGGSGTGAVSYSVTNGTALGCNVTGSTLTALKYGTCNVIATKAADPSYLSATSIAATETFVQASQTTLTLMSLSGVYPGTIALVVSGGSGTGTLSYTVASGTASGCSVAGTTLSATSVGTCQVTATQAADNNYLAATTGAVTVTFNLAAPTITTPTTASPATSPHNGNLTFTLTGTGFVSGSVVTGNGSATVTSYVYLSATQIRVTVSGSGGAGALGTFTVTNPSGASVTSQSGSFKNG